MATAHHAVVPAAAVFNPVLLDLELARKAATLLTSRVPERTREEITVDVLGRLEAEKQARELKGLNHWSEHAPKFLDQILRNIQREAAARRELLGVFYKLNHGAALAFACAALGDRDEAQDAVSQTYIELLRGKTTPGHYFRALKMNILDRQRRRSYAMGLLETTEETFDSRQGSGEDGEGDEGSWEAVSTRLDDQDPLNILITREDHAEHEREIQRAKDLAQHDSRYCWIGQKKWGKELGIVTTRIRKS